MSDERQHWYRLLNLEPGASPEEVKRAFREQVGLWHPDRFAGDPVAQRRAADRLRQIIEAYHGLLAEPAADVRAPRGARSRRSPGWPGDAASGTIRRPTGMGNLSGLLPNRLFLALLFSAGLLATVRFGWSGQGAAYLAELVLVPALFSLAYNFLVVEGLLVRNLYVGFTAAALVLVVATAVAVGREPGEPGLSAAPADGPAFSAGGEEASPARSFSGGVLEDSRMERGHPGLSGARPPVPPTVPAAPVAPAAPLAPLVPPAH